MSKLCKYSKTLARKWEGFVNGDLFLTFDSTIHFGHSTIVALTIDTEI